MDVPWLSSIFSPLLTKKIWVSSGADDQPNWIDENNSRAAPTSPGVKQNARANSADVMSASSSSSFSFGTVVGAGTQELVASLLLPLGETTAESETCYSLSLSEPTF